MSSRLDKPRLPLSLGQRPGLSHDVRSDLGHGTAVDKHHKPRQKSQTFPYTVDDHEGAEELVDLDDELLRKVVNKIATPYKSSDSLIGRSADHSARVNGNHPVAIGESVAKGLVPFPGMYKKRLQVGGGVNSPTLIRPGQYNRTGTYRGWSHAPVDLEVEMPYDKDVEQEEMALKKVRKLVRSVLKMNDDEI